MDIKINWYVYNNNKLLVARKNQPAIYDGKNYLIYEKDDEYHKIDFSNKVFIRKTKEYDMEVDFTNNICTFNFDKEGMSKVEVITNFKFKNEKLKMDYKIDVDVAKIVVEII